MIEGENPEWSVPRAAKNSEVALVQGQDIEGVVARRKSADRCVSQSDLHVGVPLHHCRTGGQIEDAEFGQGVSTTPQLVHEPDLGFHAPELEDQVVQLCCHERRENERAGVAPQDLAQD